jgi:hypothetical protein
MEKLKLKRDMNVFGYDFEKDGLVSISGQFIEIKYGTDEDHVLIPLICETFGKTSTEFMEELSKQNNN